MGQHEEELIIRSLQQLTTAEEDEELSRWRQASPVNEKYYAEVTALWVVTDVGDSVVETQRPEVAVIRRRAEAGRASPLRRRRRAPAWRHGWLAAATAAAVVGITGAIAYLRPTAVDNPSMSFGVTEYHTGAGERATVRLADGSIVRLAPSSSLRFTANSATREVRLKGRAFFGVAKVDRLPFIVRTREGDAHVLGTRFDVGVMNGELRVIVVEGRVEVAAQDQVVEVSRGQMALTSEGQEPAVVDVDVQPMLAWMGQSLVFQETPLGQAIHEIEMIYGVEIQLRDRDLASRKITAWFVDQPFEDVMAIVCRAVQVSCSIGANSAEITTSLHSAVIAPGR